MPVDSDGLTYWELTYPVETLEQRIEMREELSTLRRDANIRLTEGGLLADIISARPRGYVTVIVRFLAGTDGPANPALESLLWRRERRPEPAPEPPRGLLRGIGRFRELVDRVFPTPESRDDLIARALSFPEGRQRLAASMVAPLRTRLDYTSIARRTFLVEEMPQGALPTYDQDLTGDTLRRAFDTLNNMGLRPDRIIMNEQDFRDIQNWAACDKEKILPVPDWCVVGAFVESYPSGRGRLVARIVEVSDYSISLEHWSREESAGYGTAFRRDDKTPFTDIWNLTEKPRLMVTVKLLPSRFERET